LQKVLPTVRSRCQTFVFQRPRLPELIRKLRLIADAEQIEVPDAALALVARGGRGAFRDAESTLDQLASATGGTITVQDVLQLLAVAVDDRRRGGDPRLPLELALVKVTRPGADLSRESLAHRLELLEAGAPVARPPVIPPASRTEEPPAPPTDAPVSLELEQ